MTSEVLIVMYHHIHGPRTPNLAGLHGTPVADFEHQLRRIRASHEIIDYPLLLAGLNGEASVPERSALITFDDGTIDHYETAFPVLDRLGTPAVFFVITDGVENRSLSAVHTRHLLARDIGEKRLREEFTKRLWKAAGRVDLLQQVSTEAAQKAHRWDDPETARFKHAVNFGLPADLRNQVMKEVFAAHVGDWPEMGDGFYLTWGDLQEMQAAGMQIGGHSDQHEALSLLSEEDLETDISRCQRLLKHRLGTDEFPFSYPFGKTEHFSPNVVDELIDHGFTAGFTSILGVNVLPTDSDGQARYRLMRIDPKDLSQYLRDDQ